MSVDRLERVDSLLKRVIADAMFRILQGETGDRFGGPVSVGDARRVAEIDDPFGGKPFPDRRGDGQTAEPGIEDPHGPRVRQRS